MANIGRALTRYWFIFPLLLIVVGLQFVVGFVVTNGAANSPIDPPVAVSWVSSTPQTQRELQPTFTPTTTPSPLPTLTPTFTPSPTRTPLPTDTPTGTLTPTAPPSPTFTPTATNTPTPLPTPSSQGRKLTVPILMYHYLSTPPPGADAIRRDLSVSPELFESHLAYLRQAGYQTISFEDLIYALSQEGELPNNAIIITFDDGYRDNYVNAFPLLRKYGYTATFFVFTQPIDTYNVDYLTWEMVIEMHQAGMEFGSHSYRHSDLSNKDVDFLVYEILGSKEAIEERIQEPVRFFSYPAGRYDDLTIRVLESAHFWGAVTTRWGAEHSHDTRFEMARIRVRGSDTVDDLVEKLDLFEN